MEDIKAIREACKDHFIERFQPSIYGTHMICNIMYSLFWKHYIRYSITYTLTVLQHMEIDSIMKLEVQHGSALSILLLVSIIGKQMLRTREHSRNDLLEREKPQMAEQT